MEWSCRLPHWLCSGSLPASEFRTLHRRSRILTMEQYGEDLIVASARFDESHLRPGGVIAGPNLFMAVDQMGYLVTMSRAPKGSNGFTSAISMQFLRPAPVGG